MALVSGEASVHVIATSQVSTHHNFAAMARTLDEDSLLQWADIMQQYEEKYRESGGKGKTESRNRIVRDLANTLKEASKETGTRLTWTNTEFKKVCSKYKYHIHAQPTVLPLENHQLLCKPQDCGGRQSRQSFSFGTWPGLVCPSCCLDQKTRRNT